jgi:Domain of unknown function (DUF4395)
VRRLLTFPNPVNEVAARLVAAGVVVMAGALLATRQWWLLVPLVYGFWARVLTGPTLSPLGQLVTRVAVPGLSLPSRPVPGPPKRFAQGIGAAVTSTIAVLHLAGADGAALVLVGMLVVFASLESALGFCVGCRIFALLMRAGLIPNSVCRECADISRRVAATA